MASISVIVPVYKVEPYLCRCVDSILAQTFTDFELVLVDDGSPDNCPALCDKYAKQDDRIHVIHQENGGLSVARNSGIEWVFEHSDSEWITFIDSDDWVHPKCLETMYEACRLQHTDICMVQLMVTENYCVDLSGNPLQRIMKVSVEEAFQNESLDPTAACGRLYRRQLFEQIRFPVGKLHEDRFITYKLLFNYTHTSIVEYPLYYYFVNIDGIVHSQWSVRRLDNLEAAENQLAFFKEKQNHEMYEYILKDYIHLLVFNLRSMKSQVAFARYEKDVRMKLRRTLREHKKLLGCSWNNDFRTYKYAYPFIARVYNRVNMILHR